MAMTNEEKEYLIGKALETEEGRTALAQAMVNPIRTSLDYQGVGRKLLVVDPLPQGALPLYDKDVDAKAYIISKRGSAPDQVVEGDRIQVPTFEVISYPQIRFSQVKERRFNIIDRAQQRAKSDIMAVEDEEIFKLIDSAATSTNAVTVSTGGLTRKALTHAFQEIEKHDLVATKIVMNAQAFSDIRVWGQAEFDPVTQHEVLQSGLFGHLWTADILISKKVPANTVYVLADPEFVGVMPIRQDIQVIPADKPEDLRIGWVIYEEIGLAVVNGMAVSKIEIHN
ncbi:MAG: phage major capsid protein [Bacillota bacterium]|nr:phage major capsid protein [Bacillota bacterium]